MRLLKAVSYYYFKIKLAVIIVACMAYTLGCSDVFANMQLNNKQLKLPYYKKFLVEITLNSQKEQDIFELLEANEILYLSASFFRDNKIKQEYYKDAHEFIENKEYININHLPNAKFNFNSYEMTLALDLPKDSFNPQLLQVASSRKKDAAAAAVAAAVQAIPLEKGGYANYNITSSKFGHQKQIAGFTTFNATNSNKDITRLKTFYRYDKTSDLTTLIVGDSNTNSGNTSGSALFGGVKYSTDFSLNPNLIVYPLAGFKGTSSLPSNNRSIC